MRADYRLEDPDDYPFDPEQDAPDVEVPIFTDEDWESLADAVEGGEFSQETEISL